MDQLFCAACSLEMRQRRALPLPGGELDLGNWCGPEGTGPAVPLPQGDPTKNALGPRSREDVPLGSKLPAAYVGARVCDQSAELWLTRLPACVSSAPGQDFGWALSPSDPRGSLVLTLLPSPRVTSRQGGVGGNEKTAVVQRIKGPTCHCRRSLLPWEAAEAQSLGRLEVHASKPKHPELSLDDKGEGCKPGTPASGAVGLRRRCQWRGGLLPLPTAVLLQKRLDPGRDGAGPVGRCDALWGPAQSQGRGQAEGLGAQPAAPKASKQGLSLCSVPAESGPELRTPEMSAMSPSLRNESLVSYASMSEEEEREGREMDGAHGGAMALPPGPEPQLAAEEDLKASRQAMLIRRCNSQGSVTSLPEDALNHVDGHSDWGHEGVSDIPSLGRVLDSSQPEEEEGVGPGTEMGTLPRVLMGPAWEKPEEEHPARSPLHSALTEESLPSSASPQGDPTPTPAPPRGLGCSRLRDGRRESWRTNIHRLLDLEEQWDQLYHQELAMWQEERATQREERARDRELQFRLLGVLTDIRDELRYLRQERASARQSQAPPAEAGPAVDPLLEPPKPEGGFPLPTAGNAPWGEPSVAGRSPFGGRGRGRRRGRPRGSSSKHRRLFLTNS